MLEQTQWAAELSWKEIESLAKYLNVSRRAKGATIFDEGAKEAYMCIIVRGSVNVIKNDATQHGKVLSRIGKGKTFGEMVLFDGEPRSATIVSADNTILLILTSQNLDRLMKEIPALAAKLLLKLGKLLSQRLRMTSGMLVDFID
jgi:CRP-like cAMP-binding protein